MAGADLSSRVPRRTVDATDIQALVKTGYGTLEAAVFLLYRVTDRRGAAAWLARLQVTSVAALQGGVSVAVHLAFSAPGLRALGLEPDLPGFAPEFLSGMAGEDARSRRLGDVGADAPERWEWGYATGEPHLLLMLYAREGGLEPLRASVAPGRGDGLELLREIPSADLNDREPFGFFDGASQPRLDWDMARTPNSRADYDYGNRIALGEFLLGYPNEYGWEAERPLVEPARDGGGVLASHPSAKRDLGLNGSYLVFRQIEQDVCGFWRFLAERAGKEGAVALAESMVGRRLDGKPLVPASSPTIDGVGPDSRDLQLNRFTYDQDVAGTACPLGAHVRRANPRIGDLPGGRQGRAKEVLRMLGLRRVGLREDVIASARFHRLLRRGRAYGRLLTPEQAMAGDSADGVSGLSFICLNASLTRQFEFVQTAWIASAKFGGLSGEGDPLLGNREPFPPGQPTDVFSIPQANGLNQRIHGLPRFTTVRGGGYFFLPSLRALRYIATVAPR